MILDAAESFSRHVELGHLEEEIDSSWSLWVSVPPSLPQLHLLLAVVIKLVDDPETSLVPPKTLLPRAPSLVPSHNFHPYYQGDSYRGHRGWGDFEKF